MQIAPLTGNQNCWNKCWNKTQEWEGFPWIGNASSQFVLFSEDFEAFGLMLLVLETKQLPGLLRLCQESPTPRNPFVLSPHYFPIDNCFTGEFPSSSSGNLFAALTSLVLPGEFWIPFWALLSSYSFLLGPLPCHPKLRVEKCLAVWVKAFRFRAFLPILRAYEKNFWSCPFRQRFFFPLSFPSFYN